MSGVIYTTVFGDTDQLKQPTRTGGERLRWVCFADQPIESHVWEVIVVPESDTPSRLCRQYKQRSHIIFPDAEWTIWADASALVTENPERIEHEATHDMMTFRHPDRSRISDECKAITKLGKATEKDVLSQLASYQADGWDTDENPQKHISNGTFMFRRNTPLVNRFNEMWHHEVQTRCLRDQMSIDYCAHKVGLEIGHFKGNVRRNGYIKYSPRHDKRMRD